MRSSLRNTMKHSQLPLEHTFKRCVISLLNRAFGIDENFYNNTLIPAAKDKFEDFLSPHELLPAFSIKTYIKNQIGVYNFFQRFLAISGLVFDKQTLKDFQENEDLFNFVEPFDIPDLEVSFSLHNNNKDYFLSSFYLFLLYFLGIRCSSSSYEYCR